ncbi:MAG: hypothetical protein ACYCX3_10565 [Thermoleophilia bacterium]
MTWRRKTWTTLLMATTLALVFSITGAVAVMPVGDPPAPLSMHTPLPADRANPAPSRPMSTPLAEGPAEAATAAAAVSISTRVEATRLLVVDDRGFLVEVWSNTGAGSVDPRIHARLHSVDGPLLVQIPKHALDQYHQLLGQIDWSILGLAYSSD